MKSHRTRELAMLAAAAAAAVALWTFNRSEEPVIVSKDAVPQAPSSIEPAASPAIPVAGEVAIPARPVAESPSTAERVTALENLAWEDDAGSLKAILAELENPQARVRTAALEATRAFGSRDAVPTLREIAARTKDAAEQKAIEETADYLELPSVLETIDAASE